MNKIPGGWEYTYPIRATRSAKKKFKEFYRPMPIFPCTYSLALARYVFGPGYGVQSQRKKKRRRYATLAALDWGVKFVEITVQWADQEQTPGSSEFVATT